MKRQGYKSDLTDAEWALLERHIPKPLPNGRPAKWERREIVNTMLYVVRNGIPWEALPNDFPPWKTVYDYFRTWRNNGLWERVNAELRQMVREQAGRSAQPSAAIIDSQSVKSSEKGG
jgi:transposase